MWLETLRAELSRCGMPVPYINSVCTELVEHLEDATAALESQGHTGAEAKALAQERMGDPLALANALKRRRAESSLCLRHPAAMAICLSIATFLTLAAIQLTTFIALHDRIPADYFDSGQMVAKHLLALIGMACLFRILRSRLGRRWIGIAMLALFVVSVTSVVKVQLHPDRKMTATLRLIP